MFGYLYLIIIVFGHRALPGPCVQGPRRQLLISRPVKSATVYADFVQIHFCLVSPSSFTSSSESKVVREIFEIDAPSFLQDLELRFIILCVGERGSHFRASELRGPPKIWKIKKNMIVKVRKKI